MAPVAAFPHYDAVRGQSRSAATQRGMPSDGAGHPRQGEVILRGWCRAHQHVLPAISPTWSGPACPDKKLVMAGLLDGTDCRRCTFVFEDLADLSRAGARGDQARATVTSREMAAEYQNSPHWLGGPDATMSATTAHIHPPAPSDRGTHSVRASAEVRIADLETLERPSGKPGARPRAKESGTPLAGRHRGSSTAAGAVASPRLYRPRWPGRIGQGRPSGGFVSVLDERERSPPRMGGH